ncbi:putative S-locus glycoprotein [Helianthus annuus]|nr:putative S-locus glycoprotein [Helianthus annuus]
MDTLLPGKRLGWDRKTGVNRFLRSWKSGMDPGSGSYTFKMNVDGFPEIFLSAGVKPVFHSGPWNGGRLSGVPTSRGCDEYLKCGPWGVCDANALPFCNCLKGFRPKNQHAWDLRDGSDGCVRSSEMDCGSDGFRLMKNMKLPEGSKAFVDQTLSLNECGDICKRNCSCAAYANTNISENGSGCVIWAVDLLDVRQYADSEGGQDLYVRAAASDLGAFLITIFFGR